MGAEVSRTDFEWVGTDEPHATRRKEILKKYPEIKKLMGYDPNVKYIVTGMVLLQLAMFWLLKDSSWTTIVVMAYCFGGFINHSLMVVLHETAHCLVFGRSRPVANKLFGIFANLPMGLPLSVSFKAYHLDHHKYQAMDTLDPDIPTYLEAKLFSTTCTKLLWIILLPFFYAIRPLIRNPKRPTTFERINMVVQVVFNVIVYQICGEKILLYMIGGSIVSMGLHPAAGHFLSEHYMFTKGFETYSCYGPLNRILFNIGYHMEHHDFPNIPCSRLPEVKRIAKEYYDDLPQHNSWLKVMYDFITDPAIGPYARIKRKQLLKTTEQEKKD